LAVTMTRRAKAVAAMTPGDSALPPPHPEERVASDSIARNTLYATVNGVISAAIAAVLTLYLIRALDPHGYGVYTLALAIGALFALVMDLGLSSSVARFIAERRGDRRAIADYVADALRLKVLIAGLVGVVLVFAAGPIADLYSKPGLTWPLRGVALALVAGSVMQLYGAVLIAQARVAAIIAMSITQSVAFLVAAVALVSAGTGATGAAFARAIGYSAAVVVGSVVDMGEADDTESALGDMARSVRPGHPALVAVATEQTREVVDTAMGSLGGTVTRRPLDVVLAEIATAEDAQRAAEKEARKKLREEREAKAKADVNAKIEELKAKVHHQPASAGSR